MSHWGCALGEGFSRGWVHGNGRTVGMVDAPAGSGSRWGFRPGLQWTTGSGTPDVCGDVGAVLPTQAWVWVLWWACEPVSGVFQFGGLFDPSPGAMPVWGIEADLCPVSGALLSGRVSRKNPGDDARGGALDVVASPGFVFRARPGWVPAGAQADQPRDTGLIDGLQALDTVGEWTSVGGDNPDQVGIPVGVDSLCVGAVADALVILQIGTHGVDHP